MKSAFVSPNDPILLKIATAILPSDLKSEDVQLALEKMLEVGFGKQKDRTKPMVVGLAAPQIGISKRIILVDILADGKGGVGDLRVFINPEITWSSEDKEEWYEGCWSTDRVTGIVSRPKSIKVKAYDQTGKFVEGEYHGYTARIFQHEIDHLNGKEFVHLITDDEKLHWVEVDQFMEYRNNEAWRQWPHKCLREKWNQIKYGK